MTTSEMTCLYGAYWARQEQAVTAAQLHRQVVISEIVSRLRDRASSYEREARRCSTNIGMWLLDTVSSEFEKFADEIEREASCPKNP